MTQIDYLLLRRCDRGLFKDCKVILGEILSTQHRLLVMDVGIMLKRRKRSDRGRPGIRWGALTKDKAQELEGRLSAMGTRRNSGGVSIIWSTTADYIREATREVLGISTGVSGSEKWQLIMEILLRLLRQQDELLFHQSRNRENILEPTSMDGSKGCFSGLPRLVCRSSPVKNL
ncbi:uncharacterized protein LOC142173435 [Nicotiana tabacum]|uniref:Uncharacterized protein LOC142173435 n=1 Tax=Nicotiana tabacum TaxID=4097 RepID=A0AC58TD30_TOBAC